VAAGAHLQGREEAVIHRWHVRLAKGGGDPAGHRAEGVGKGVWKYLLTAQEEKNWYAHPLPCSRAHMYAAHRESGDSRCPHRSRICAPLRCMSLSGHGRGVRMQLQTRAVACSLLASAPAMPIPYAASVLPLTTSVRCDLRYRHIIALCRHRRRGERAPDRFGARAAAAA
jgi:hypothetical protein